MLKFALFATTAAVLVIAPLGTSTKAQTVEPQIGRDRDFSRDRDYRRERRVEPGATVGIGPGGVTVGPRRNCRSVTTTVHRDDGRIIKRRETRCD